jgi:hypothetical protein
LITQFSVDPHVVETGTTYLRLVGPAYGFFGLGLALYFASQGGDGCSGRYPPVSCACWSQSALDGSRFA